jgi:uncharacterized protein with PIN domain
MDPEAPDFLCDAMLGGLARWLRAAGYDAEFVYGIEDRRLIERTLRTGAVLLSSDGRLFERNVIKSGQVRAVFVPRELTKAGQLAFVLRQLKLPVREPPRCMACGGRLDEVSPESVRSEAPRKTFQSCRQFWRCRRCGKLLWQGTHWRRISAALESVRGDVNRAP